VRSVATNQSLSLPTVAAAQRRDHPSPRSYARISRTPLSSAISKISAGLSAKMPTVMTPGIWLIRASISTGLEIWRSSTSRI